MIHTNITNKQKEILLHLYRFRFLNRLQLQQLLNHTTYKRINLWLKDLTEKEYTTRIFKRSWTENSTPAKYYIALNGIRFLKTQPNCKKEYLEKLYREKDRSEKFIDKSLFIANVYLKFIGDFKNDISNYKFSTQSDLTPKSIVSDIMPDFLIIRSNNTTKHFNLFQLFPEGTPRFAVRKRIEKYMTFLTEEDGTQLSANLHLIAQTDALHKYLTRHVERILQDESISVPIRVSTYDQIARHGIRSEDLEAQTGDTDEN